MHIERADSLPPNSAIIAHNEKYGELFTALTESPEAWHIVSLDDIAGPHNYKKQATVHAAAAHRKLRVKTAVRGDVMYIRLRPASTESEG